MEKGMHKMAAMIHCRLVLILVVIGCHGAMSLQLTVKREKNGDTFGTKDACLRCNESDAYSFSASCANKECCRICKCRNSNTFVIDTNHSNAIAGGKCSRNPPFDADVFQNPSCSYHIGGEAPVKIFRHADLMSSKLGIITKAFNQRMKHNCRTLHATVWDGQRWIQPARAHNVNNDFDLQYEDYSTASSKARLFLPVLYFYGRPLAYMGRIVRVHVECGHVVSCLMFKAAGSHTYSIHKPPTMPPLTTIAPVAVNRTSRLPIPIANYTGEERPRVVIPPEVIVRRPEPETRSTPTGRPQNLIVLILAVVVVVLAVGFTVMAALLIRKRRRDRLLGLEMGKDKPTDDIPVQNISINHEFGQANNGFEPDSPKASRALPTIDQSLDTHYEATENDYETVDYSERLYQTLEAVPKKTSLQEDKQDIVCEDLGLSSWKPEEDGDVRPVQRKSESSAPVQYTNEAYASLGVVRERAKSYAASTPDYQMKTLTKAISEDLSNRTSQHYQTISSDDISQYSTYFTLAGRADRVRAQIENTEPSYMSPTGRAVPDYKTAPEIPLKEAQKNQGEASKDYESPAECRQHYKDLTNQSEALYQLPVKTN